jgi:hypothetical protein
MKQNSASPGELLTNAELKRLLEQTQTRLENWKLEIERNPNPRLVHVLKNIVGHIESLTRITETKIRYSYKTLSRQMSVLINEVAALNMAITDSLMDDDLVDEAEEQRINASLKRVVQAALDLIWIVQQAFALNPSLRRLPEAQAGLEAGPAGEVKGIGTGDPRD